VHTLAHLLEHVPILLGEPDEPAPQAPGSHLKCGLHDLVALHVLHQVHQLALGQCQQTGDECIPVCGTALLEALLHNVGRVLLAAELE